VITYDLRDFKGIRGGVKFVCAGHWVRPKVAAAKNAILSCNVKLQSAITPVL